MRRVYQKMTSVELLEANDDVSDLSAAEKDKAARKAEAEAERLRLEEEARAKAEAETAAAAEAERMRLEVEEARVKAKAAAAAAEAKTDIVNEPKRALSIGEQSKFNIKNLKELKETNNSKPAKSYKADIHEKMINELKKIEILEYEDELNEIADEIKRELIKNVLI